MRGSSSTMDYPDSDYSIRYGNSEGNVIPTCTADSQKISADIDLFLQFAQAQTQTNVVQARKRSGSTLLARHNRL